MPVYIMMLTLALLLVLAVAACTWICGAREPQAAPEVAEWPSRKRRSF